MMKLNASYSKKVPADTEYSSQSYHCQIEVELPEGLTPQQLNERVHGVFDFVRVSVENELHNSARQSEAPQQQSQPVQQNYQAVVSQPQQNNAAQSARSRSNAQRGNGLASPKQIQYLLSLASRAGWDCNEILRQNNISAFEQLSSKACSSLIDQLSGRVATAA